MKMKFNKYIKIFMSISLIFALICPLYAETGASDTSAFVTKEEFDKALSAFNERLTIFEAGINSKIDVQVTSYLDRNGIWSEAIQESELETAWIVNQKDFGTSSLSAKTVYYWVGDDAAKGMVVKDTSVTCTCYYFTSDYSYKDHDIILKCDKSGLLFGNLAERMDGCFENSTTDYIVSPESSYVGKTWSHVFHDLPSDKKNYTNLVNAQPSSNWSGNGFGVTMAWTTTRGVLSYFNQHASWVVKIINQKGDLLYCSKSFDFAASDQRGEASYWGNTEISNFPNIHNLMFFVEKGDKITLQAGWQGSGRNIGGDMMILNIWDNPTNQLIWAYATEKLSVY